MYVQIPAEMYILLLYLYNVFLVGLNYFFVTAVVSCRVKIIIIEQYCCTHTWLALGGEWQA